MRGGSLSNPLGGGLSCCYVGGSESALSPAVVPASTSIALKEAKKFPVGTTGSTTAHSIFLSQPCFLEGLGLAPSETFTLFLLR